MAKSKPSKKGNPGKKPVKTKPVHKPLVKKPVAAKPANYIHESLIGWTPPDPLSRQEQAIIAEFHATVPSSIARMTHAEFKQALTDLKVSQAWLASWVGVERHQVNRWTRENRAPVPYWLTFVVYLLQRELDQIEPVWRQLEFPLEAKFPHPSKREDAPPVLLRRRAA